MSQPSSKPSSASGPVVASNLPDPRVDVAALAERVYRLLLADLALQTRRQGGPS